MKKIALIHYETDHSHSMAEDEGRDLVSHFNQLGFSASLQIWDDKKVNWADFDPLIIKSPWDYFNKIEAFYRWFDHVETLGIKILNPLSVMRWNTDKHYLRDIDNNGLKVAPLQFLEKGSSASLNNFFSQFDTEELVIKPCVSGGSKNTFRVKKTDVAKIENTIAPLLKTEAFIVQPFLKEIVDEGEWSFLFFGGEFSHSLIKKAKTGDFRVQGFFGGSVHPQTPSPSQIAEVKPYVDQFAKNCLYARVDGVYLNGKFNLLELELVEPYLFLSVDPKSIETYSRTLLEMLGRK